MKKYDYIIAGAGLAGLMLALEMSKSSLKNKKVLLVDKDPKNTNDRTWCFWAKQASFIISQKIMNMLQRKKRNT